MEELNVGATAVAAVVASLLTVMGNFFLNKRKQDVELEQKQKASELDLEDHVRAKLYDETEKFRQTLQDEILSLRARLVKLEEDKLRYAIENAELRVRVKELETDTAVLKKFILEKTNIDPSLLVNKSSSV